MSLPERLSENLYKDGIISDEEREIVQFGLESMRGNLVGVFLTLVVGCLYGRVIEGILFYLLFFPLRKSVGGFHAKTKLRCILISTMTLILTFALYTIHDKHLLFCHICFGIGSCVIFVLAPIDNPSKQFDDMERVVYRKRSRIVLIGEVILFLVAIFFSWDMVIRSISMVFFVTCFALIMAIISKKIL